MASFLVLQKIAHQTLAISLLFDELLCLDRARWTTNRLEQDPVDSIDFGNDQVAIVVLRAVVLVIPDRLNRNLELPARHQADHAGAELVMVAGVLSPCSVVIDLLNVGDSFMLVH